MRSGQLSVPLLLLLLLLLSLLLFARASRDDTFVVSMTTIPPRFSSVHHTLSSWLSQSTFLPECVVVFVPQTYKRFRRKSNNATATEMLTTVDFLAHSLRENAPHLSPHLAPNGRIRLLSMETDFGPATKLAGILVHRLALQRAGCNPAFWVFGDDDVAYTPRTLERYQLKMTMPPPGMSSTELLTSVLTHFSHDTRRMSVQLANEGGVVRRITHVQGVDTVLLPEKLLHSQYKDGEIFHPAVFKRLLEAAFTNCPDVFYQDDYVIALLLNLAGIRVVSAWNNDHVAKHVEGVSKSNSQLHTKPDVFKREEAAKACLSRKADLLVDVAREEGRKVRGEAGVGAELRL